MAGHPEMFTSSAAVMPPQGQHPGQNQKQKTENRKQKTENRKQKTENRKQKTENRKQKTENRKTLKQAKAKANLFFLILSFGFSLECNLFGFDLGFDLGFDF